MPDAPLPIRGWFIDQSDNVPVIVVDASARADVLEYCRLLHGAGGGRIMSGWYNTKRPNGELVLRVVTVTPSVCRFGVQFDLPEQLALVTALGSAERVRLTTAAWAPGTAYDELSALDVPCGDPYRVPIRDALSRVAR